MNRFLRDICPLILVLVIAGCQEQEEIRRYKVSKTKSSTSEVATVGSGEPARMLAAILFEDDTSWFFKLTGSPDDAGSADDGFRSLLKSIRFVNAEPEWTLPEGWTETKPKSGIRFATLTVPVGDKSLELSVIPLPVTTDRNEWLLSNVNRWRVDQLSLLKLEASDLATAFESIEYDGGVANFVDLTGTKKESRMGGGAQFAPFAGGGASAPAINSTERSRDSSGQPSFTTPDGWKRSSNDQFSNLALDAPGGARFTATQLSGPFAKDLLENVNRWRRQVGLQHLSADELASNVDQVDIDGEPASYSKSVGGEKTILGAILVQGDVAWFFKLAGENAATEAERENFEQLLTTIKFPSE